MVFDVVIIGAGVAGLTAGIYTGRARLKGIILERFQPGGQILRTEKIENFPGYLEDHPYNLIENLKKQVEYFGTNILCEEVLKIENSGEYKTITTDKNQYRSYAVIIATGAKPKPLGLLNEDSFVGKGISYCATCDAPFFKNKDVAVVGGGDTSLTEAIYLTRFVNKLFLIHRRKELRATKILQEQIFNKTNVEFFLGYQPVELIGTDTLEGLKIKEIETSTEKTLRVAGLFVFIGQIPETAFLEGLLELTNEKYIVVSPTMETSVQGIFACGDVIAKPLRQVVTACSEGAIAAVSAEKYISNLLK